MGAKGRIGGAASSGCRLRMGTGRMPSLRKGFRFTRARIGTTGLIDTVGRTKGDSGTLGGSNRGVTGRSTFEWVGGRGGKGGLREGGRGGSGVLRTSRTGGRMDGTDRTVEPLAKDLIGTGRSFLSPKIDVQNFTRDKTGRGRDQPRIGWACGNGKR